MYPDSVRRLIESFKCLPGIGEKTAERFAFSMINFDKELLTDFIESITLVRDRIERCSVCNNISEGDMCSICLDKLRNNEVIFVVEKPKDVILFEKLGVYHGVYHVLDGLISPLDGINPDDINISGLVKRVSEEKTKEVILALKPNVEGETTMQYIRRILENMGVGVSKIATGIPIGTDIEYIDAMTLELALEERKKFS